MTSLTLPSRPGRRDNERRPRLAQCPCRMQRPCLVRCLRLVQQADLVKWRCLAQRRGSQQGDRAECRDAPGCGRGRTGRGVGAWHYAPEDASHYGLHLNRPR